MCVTLLFAQFGEKAEYYKQNQSEFSHKSLLRDFGANEQLADEMLTDKGISFDRGIYKHHRDHPELYYDRSEHFTFILLKVQSNMFSIVDRFIVTSRYIAFSHVLVLASTIEIATISF